MTEECFICCEPGGQKRCKCNTVVHDQCLFRMIATVPSHNGKCAVCKQNYFSVSVKQTKECKMLFSFYVFVALYCLLGLELFAVFMTMNHVQKYGNNVVWLYVEITVAICHILFTLSLHYFHLMNTNKCCCCFVARSHIQMLEMALLSV